MSLRDRASSKLTDAEKKQLDRAEQGRTGRKAIRQVAERTRVPATGHPQYRRGQGS
jgi:hypothetical protein